MQRTVLITGASSGIGEATARRFLAAGWNVAAGMRRPERCRLDAAAPGLAVLAMDVTSDASIADAVERTTARFGAIDVLVNNAGYALLGPLEGLSPEQLRRQIDTNVLGLIAVTRQVLPGMRARRDGAIVNIASIGGRMAFPFTAAYHATKFAVEGLSESIRFELRAHDIRVKVIEPGPIRTNFLAGGAEWASHDAYAQELANFRRMSDRLEAEMPGPDVVARTVFRAATDRSQRLRYTVAAGPFPLLHRLLPDAVWRRLIAFELARRSK
jgi:NAD(P)-dependent dehydrogenase (short-subunit alcohol dehydrogenase family)